jgi:hypothetical protein
LSNYFSIDILSEFSENSSFFSSFLLSLHRLFPLQASAAPPSLSDSQLPVLLRVDDLMTPAPPRRLVPAKPSADIADKTTLLDLSDKVCRWPMGHPGEPDFHFCGEQVNPGFPYCVDHCGRAYQAQLPRGVRRPPPPLPFGAPRVR